MLSTEPVDNSVDNSKNNSGVYWYYRVFFDIA